MKQTLLLAALVGLLSAPSFARAEAGTTTAQTPQPSEAKIFTACSQTAIEIRDESIGSARAAYNNAMAVALDDRKEAEKKAVALEDEGEKKDAIKKAVENYKEAVTEAQDALIKARKEAWGAFEANTKACREMNKEKRETATVEKKDAEGTSSRTLQAKAEKSETKSLTETLIESIKSFFKLKSE